MLRRNGFSLWSTNEITSIRRTLAGQPSTYYPTATTPVFCRSISSTRPVFATQPPPGNQPPSAQQAGRQSQPVQDKQSSASKEEHLQGDDHPAKQPDTQVKPERSTGFHDNVQEVKGGKEGLGQRTDRDPEVKGPDH